MKHHDRLNDSREEVVRRSEAFPSDGLGAAQSEVVLRHLAIMLAVLGFNLFGDGLRDVLDPKAR